MILQLHHITHAMYLETVDQQKKKIPSTTLKLLHFESFHEGLCMQIMHMDLIFDNKGLHRGMKEDEQYKYLYRSLPGSWREKDLRRKHRLARLV
jgi:hypothetical protein